MLNKEICIRCFKNKGQYLADLEHYWDWKEGYVACFFGHGVLYPIDRFPDNECLYYIEQIMCF